MARVTNELITMLEHSRVYPVSNEDLSNKSFPLSYLDVHWVTLTPVHHLFFHELSHPISHLIDTTLPNLKHSLSITLHHFFLLAGNLILFPFTDSTVISKIPEICYVDGDSVPFTLAESKMDFLYLTKSDPRKANTFYPLVPKLGDRTRDSSDKTTRVPLLSIQVTLFPNHGICIGITCHHVVNDASAFLNFLRAWASINKFGNDKPFLSSQSLPFFDKSVINDPSGICATLWSRISKTQFQEPPTIHTCNNDDLVRASFIMTKDQVSKVKKSILVHRPTIARISTFTIVCAHVWTCMAKARDVAGELKGSGDPELIFGLLAECRARFDPPLPTTYFGNCLVAAFTNAKKKQLLGEEGFFDAVELIRDAILERLKSKESIDAGLLVFIQDFLSFPTTVAGSTKFDFYDTDFGWGKPKKHEFVSIDYSQAISLNLSRGSSEDIEIGLSLPNAQMDVFPTIFNNELKRITIGF